MASWHQDRLVLGAVAAAVRLGAPEAQSQELAGSLSVWEIYGKPVGKSLKDFWKIFGRFLEDFWEIIESLWEI